MATTASLPTPPRYRLVVTASHPKGKGFIWVENEPASREGYVLRRSCERFDTAAVIKQSG